MGEAVASASRVALLNREGQKLVDNILKNGTRSPNRFGGYDITDSLGRGVRYDGRGKFMGFLEP